MKRGQFLKLGLFPAGLAAAKAARAIDPSGEPMREVDGQLVVNGSNVTIQNVSFRTGPARSAIRMDEKARGATITNTIMRADS